MPAQRTETGFILFPTQVIPVAIKTQKKLKRVGWEQVEAVATPKPAKLPIGTSVEDLKTALEMLRTIASDLGAELYVADGILKARIEL